LELSEGNTIFFHVNQKRQAYLVQIEGTSMINDFPLEARDAMEIIEEDINITAHTTSHFLVIEMAKA
jgi:redox-sensitive bicupin YhaK (pirin superfamily)